MLGDVNKYFVFKSLLTMPSNVLLLHLKQTFPPIIWIFTECQGVDWIQATFWNLFYYFIWDNLVSYFIIDSFRGFFTLVVSMILKNNLVKTRAREDNGPVNLCPWFLLYKIVSFTDPKILGSSRPILFFGCYLIKSCVVWKVVFVYNFADLEDVNWLVK